MWFEILPAFGIITVALAIPGVAIYNIQKLWIDNVKELTLYLRFLHNLNNIIALTEEGRTITKIFCIF